MIKIISITALALAVSSCASVENILNSPDNVQSTPATMTAINAEKGLVTKQSNHSAQDTADKLRSLIKSKGLTLFTSIDHQRNSENVGLTLKPTQVIIFGNPKAGTPLMKCAPTVAIDLPQKMLINEDAEGKVWLSYNAVDYLIDRHNIEGCDKVLGNISTLLNDLSTEATAK